MTLNYFASITTTFELAGPKTEPIRIGLISDTHIPADARRLPPQVKEAFQDTHLILHAGDIYLPGVLDELETIAPVLAVRGNDDGGLPDDYRFKDIQVLNFNGFKLGLTHRGYYPDAPVHSLDRLMRREFGELVDIIVYGDTHVAMVESYNDILMVNPGSPTSPNHLLELGTVAILEITGNRAQARIIHLSELSSPFNQEDIYYRGAGA